MALPKEPRQKMINIMYLVLTALLALNVSSEILNAFKTVDESLQKSSILARVSTAQYILSLDEKRKQAESKELADKWYPKAITAQNLTNDIFNYIDGIKATILKDADFDPVKNGDSTFKEDDLEVSTRIMVEGNTGRELLKKLQDYKVQLLAIDPLIAKQLANDLPIDLGMPKVANKANNTWESAYFQMTPTVAAITMLSKFQNDVRISENRVIEFCHKQVGQVEVIFDTYKPLVTSNATYLMDGQELEISAGLGAFNSKNVPKITINGSPATVGPDGLATQKFVVNGVGSKTVNVNITYTDQYGKIQSIPKQIQYIVGSPTGASVSADDVKVLYIGLENHLSVSGGNMGDEKVHVSIDNGEITKSGSGKYVVKPSKAGTANVTLNIDGEKAQTFSFRVKTVPNPVAKVGISGGGRIKVNDFKAQSGVAAVLENFIFEGVRFNVVSYTIVLNGAGFPNLAFRQVTSDSFDPVRDLIEKAKGGTTITIDEIKANGPGGTRNLAPIAFNLY